MQLALAGLAGVFALITGYGFVDQRRRSAAISEAGTTTTQGIYEGNVGLEGTIAAGEAGTLTAPLTGEDAVLLDWEIREVNDDEEGPPDRVGHGRQAAEFVLEDGHGSVRVDPDGVQLMASAGASTTETQMANMEPSDDVVSFLESFENDHGGTDREGVSVRASGTEMTRHKTQAANERRRYTHEALGPGDEVYVLGNARSNGDGEFAIGDGDGKFLLSDMGPEALQDDLKQTTWLLGAIAGASVIAAIYFLVA